MITRTVEVHEGEWLGPIDWEYNFRQHFDRMGCSEERKAEECRACVDCLRKLEAEPDRYRVRLAHGTVEREVYRVGMYDGWPYWKPTPAILTSGTLSPEVRFFQDVIALHPR